MEINNTLSYLIGLFQTDGNQYKMKDGKKGKFVIELSSKDEDIIINIKDYISYNYSISKRNKDTIIKDKKYNSDYIKLSVCDYEFRSFLYEHGVPYGKKSKTIKPPLHIKNLSIKDYIRGLYDGDGSLGLTSNGFPFISFTTDSDDIAEYLNKYISEIIE